MRAGQAGKGNDARSAQLRQEPVRFLAELLTPAVRAKKPPARKRRAKATAAA